VKQWKQGEETRDAIVQIGGTALSMITGIAAIFVSGGWAALLIAISIASGATSSAYSFSIAREKYFLSLTQVVGEKLISKDDADSAKLDYILGIVDLVLVGVDFISAIKTINRMRKLASHDLAAAAKALKYSQEMSELKTFASANEIKVPEELISKIYTNTLRENIDLTKNILLSSKEVREGKKVNELVIILKLSEEPVEKTLTNYEARVWYAWQKSSIKTKLNPTKPLEQQARDACKRRNEIRITARKSMKDQNLAKFLDGQEKEVIFENLVQRYKALNMKEEEIWGRIIEGSMKGRDEVDTLFKITL
jgi:hypothetical protein